MLFSANGTQCLYYVLFAVAARRSFEKFPAKGPTNLLLSGGGGGVWVISEKISCRLISGVKNILQGNTCHGFVVRGKNSIPRGLETKILAQTKSPIPSPPPFKSEMVGS